jgi:hypothetical protein
MAYKFADEPVDMLTRNLGLDLPAQAVDSLRQGQGDAELLREPDYRLGALGLPTPAGQTDADRAGGKWARGVG